MKAKEIIKNYAKDDNQNVKNILIHIWFSETTSEDNLKRIRLNDLLNDELGNTEVTSWEVGHGTDENGKSCLCLQFYTY